MAVNDAKPLAFCAAFDRLDPARVRAAWHHLSSDAMGQDGLLPRIGTLLLERLEEIRLAPECILALGDRTGQLARQLQDRWPKARIVALTFAEGLAQRARYRSMPWQRRPWNMVGDPAHLPFKGAHFDLVISNMALHWTAELPMTLREIRRVLAPDRPLLFTVAGSETLWELHACLAQLDQARQGRTWQRGPVLPSLQSMGDLLLSSGFVQPVTDRDRVSVPFSRLPWLLHQLKSMGAGNHLRTRPQGLRGRSYVEQLHELYASRFQDTDHNLTCTLELLFGHAWKAPQKKPLR